MLFVLLPNFSELNCTFLDFQLTMIPTTRKATTDYYRVRVGRTAAILHAISKGEGGGIKRTRGTTPLSSGTD